MIGNKRRININQEKRIEKLAVNKREDFNSFINKQKHDLLFTNELTQSSQSLCLDNNTLLLLACQEYKSQILLENTERIPYAQDQ